jgi:hypothetical protein
VPAVPLLDAHGEGVDVLVEGVQQRDALDDHVVLPAGPGVAEAGRGWVCGQKTNVHATVGCDGL